MANETKRLTPEAEREIDSRVDIRYSALLGAESHERALLLSEIQHLRRERDTARELQDKYKLMRQAMEVIAVGDSSNPAVNAAESLVEIGEWCRSALDVARDEGAIPAKPGPVRLTDEAIAMALHVWAGADPDELDMDAWRDDPSGIEMLEVARIIETAVLAANGLEAAR